MPTALRTKGYRFYFVMFDLNEPIHIHVDKQGKTAKFWLSPLQLALTHGYRNHELNEIESIIMTGLTNSLRSGMRKKQNYYEYNSSFHPTT